MKKVIASVLVLVFGASMVMAQEPVVTIAGSTGEELTLSDDVFAAVEGQALSEEEAKKVDGSSVYVTGIIVGAVSGAVSSYLSQTVPAITSGKPVSVNWGQVAGSAVSGAMLAAIAPATAFQTTAQIAQYIGARALSGAAAGLVTSAVNR